MIPKVVIVGRPNVGKSSLLNMLAGRMVSIVDSMAGVTRDRIATYAELPNPDAPTEPGLCVELIDTGGHGIKDSQNLTLDVEKQIALGIAEADVILFLIDAHDGVVPLDQDVAKLLRQAGAAPAPSPSEGEGGGEGGKKRSKKKTKRAGGKKSASPLTPTLSPEGRGRQGSHGAPVVLIPNKVDDEKFESTAQEASRLGFGAPLMISATTKHNRTRFLLTLRDRIIAAAGAKALAMGDPRPLLEERPDPGVLVAIVGKRNAGKSTLVNALAGANRVIVSEVEGTTRDSIDVRFEMGKDVFTAIDTAGVRKRKSVKEDIEFYSLHRALRSIRRADVVLFVVDATVPISQVDESLSTEIQRHFKPALIVVNKWDLVEKEHDQEEYMKYLEKHLKGFSYAPIAFMSAKDGKGMRELMQTALSLHEQAAKRVPTAELNRVLEEVLKAKPPSNKLGRRPRVYYVTQLDVKPPTIGLFVNDLTLFDAGYQRYLMNRFRESLPFEEVPMKLVIRGKDAMKKEEV